MRSLVVGLLGLREDEASVEVTGGIATTLNGSVAMAYRSTSKLIFAFAFTACTLALAPPPASAGGAAHAAELKSGATLKRIAVIDLPGPPGRRFDYLAIDDEDRYLFSAHLAAGLLYVIDLRSNTVVKTIPDVPGIEGVAYVAELRKVYTADFWEKKIGVFDAACEPAAGVSR